MHRLEDAHPRAVAEHESDEHDLRHRVHLRDPERLHRHRTAEHIGEQHTADDEEVAADDEHDQPGGQHALEAERDEDGDEQRLVGDRIEIGAELGGGVEALGDEAVGGIRECPPG